MHSKIYSLRKLGQRTVKFTLTLPEVCHLNSLLIFLSSVNIMVISDYVKFGTSGLNVGFLF